MKVLLIRFSAIGDCVMAGWCATSIRNAIPDVQLTWALEARCVPVINTADLVNNVVPFPRDKWKKNRWSPATWQQQLTIYARLRKQNFDWGLDLQGHSKTAIALRLAFPRKRLMARATDSLAAKLNPVMAPPPQLIHTVEWNHLALCEFGQFSLPASPIMPQRTTVDKGLVTISTGAGHLDKQWPIERWNEVGRRLLKLGWAVAFLGGVSDPVPNCPGAKNYVGQLPLGETLQRVSASELHLAGDTGTGHMAAAYGIPSVSIFGPTDPNVFRPYARSSTVLKQGSNTNDVSVDLVMEAAQIFTLSKPGNAN